MEAINLLLELLINPFVDDYYNFAIEQSFWGRIMIVAPYLPLIIIAAWFVRKYIYKQKVYASLAVLLYIECTIWTVWEYYFDIEINPEYELYTYYANIVVYVFMASVIHRLFNTMAGTMLIYGYLLSTIVVIMNAIAYLTDGLAIFEWAYDQYFNLMTVIIILMVIAAGGGMYDNRNGGKRAGFFGYYRGHSKYSWLDAQGYYGQAFG